MNAAPPPNLARAVWPLAAATALLTAWAEVAELTARAWLLGTFHHRGPDYWWVTPLAYLLLFALPAALLALGARLWPRVVTWRVAAFLLALGACGSLLILIAFARIHPAALALLALGVAAQAARLAERHAAAVLRWSRRITAALGALTLALAVALPARRALGERRALAALPAAPEGAPSVLLLILDTVRAASLSVYGHARPTTPQLERWARRGVVFEHAIAPSPWTLPSHASLFTGLPAHELSASWLVALDDSTPTLAETLRHAGWATAGFVANDVYATAEQGLARGFARYEDYPVSLGLVVRAAAPLRQLLDSYVPRVWVGTDDRPARRSAAAVNAAFLSWWRRSGVRASGRPYFAFLNYFDAHDPYLPDHDDFRSLTGRERGDDLSPLRRIRSIARRGGVPADVVALERDSYEAAILGLDRQIGALLDTLDAAGALRHTIVVITSDHGEEFGERGVFYHGHTLYAPAVHVPLLVIYPPAVPAGRRIAGPVALSDVAATVLELARRPPALPGRSLARWWHDPARPLAPDTVLTSVRRGIRIPDWYPGAAGDLAAVFAGPAHYIRRADGREELFEWLRDPDQRADLAPGGADPRLAALRPPAVRALSRLR